MVVLLACVIAYYWLIVILVFVMFYCLIAAAYMLFNVIMLFSFGLLYLHDSLCGLFAMFFCVICFDYCYCCLVRVWSFLVNLDMFMVACLWLIALFVCLFCLFTLLLGLLFGFTLVVCLFYEGGGLCLFGFLCSLCVFTWFVIRVWLCCFTCNSVVLTLFFYVLLF